jgi:hypothetical protein
MNPRHAAALALAVLSLSGCATGSKNLTLSGFGAEHVLGNAWSVTISPIQNETDALPLANFHCANYNKSARFTHMEGDRAFFDCVDSNPIQLHPAKI